jgi:hypothetical protein
MSNSKAGRKYSIQLIFFLAVYCSTTATTMSVTWPIYNIIAPAEHDGNPPLQKVRDSGQGNDPNSIASMARLTGGYTLGLGPRHVRNLYCLSPQPLKLPHGPWTGVHGLGSYLNRSSPAPHESMTEPCCIAYQSFLQHLNDWSLQHSSANRPAVYFNHLPSDPFMAIEIVCPYKLCM